ncbi:hypothetical protein TNCV_673361 [Trichonephila clavipes]|uniref:Uncharacterized protein n=1 Tax=Trichonephila clavipes TaxID=2585209 RepID=A0A8X7BI34_TRICX|nr:hypothetical protein TNCV_673361 [Trichonephila clavipes]
MEVLSMTVIHLHMAMSIVELLQERCKRVGSGGTLRENPVLSQNLLIICPAVFYWVSGLQETCLALRSPASVR